jgi:hypothetical protein
MSTDHLCELFLDGAEKYQGIKFFATVQSARDLIDVVANGINLEKESGININDWLPPPSHFSYGHIIEKRTDEMGKSQLSIIRHPTPSNFFLWGNFHRKKFVFSDRHVFPFAYIFFPVASGG